MKKTIVKSLALAFLGSLVMAGSAMALPALDYYTGNSADSVYNDLTGVNYVGLTDNTYPESAPHIAQMSFESILATYQHDYQIGIFDIDGSGNLETQLLVLDTYQSTTASNVIFDTSLGVASTTLGGTADISSNQFGYYLRFYTDIGGGNLSSEEYFSDRDADIFGFYYDMYGIASLNFSETAVSFGGPDTQGSVLLAVDDVAPVPEPASMLLLGTGLACLAGVSRRRKDKKA